MSTPDDRNRWRNTAHDPTHLEEYRKPTLQAYCREYGLPVDGTKDELLERLAASPATPWDESDVFATTEEGDA